MTVSVLTLGPQTKQFSISDELSSTALMEAIDAWLTTPTQPGWTQYDAFNAFGVYTYVYRILNKDAITYKYLILIFNTVENRIYTSTCESWNATTHVPVNEAYTHRKTIYVGYHMNNCDIIVFASPRWVILQGFSRNEPSLWMGVTEIERDAPEDTAAAGYPCWVWVNSLYLGGGLDANVSTTQQNTEGPAFPRTRGGVTSQAANTNVAIITPFGGFGTFNSVAGLYTHKIADVLGHASGPTIYGWDTNKKILHSIKLMTECKSSSPSTYGRLFGLKAVPAIGELMNKVSIPIDADGFFDATGTSTDHWILPTTVNALGTNIAPLYFGVNKMQYTVAPTTKVIYAVVHNGSSYYAATTTGVIKFDAATLSYSVVDAISQASSIHDIVYDGSRYAYASGVGQVYKIDTVDDTVTTLAIASGAGVMCTDGTTLMVADRTFRAIPVMYQIDLGTFTLVRTITSTVTVSPGTGMFQSICTDWNGIFYAILLGPAAGDQRIFKIIASTGVISANTPAGWPTPVIHAGILYDGVDVVCYAGGGTSVTVFRTYPGLGFGNYVNNYSFAITLTAQGGVQSRSDCYLFGGLMYHVPHSSNGNGFAVYPGTHHAVYRLANSYSQVASMNATGGIANFYAGTDGYRHLIGTPTGLQVATGAMSRYKHDSSPATASGEFVLPV